jgi:(2S)-methylsuccinyl-CoA dehydrogenase
MPNADRYGAGLELIELARATARAAETVLRDATVAVRECVCIGQRIVPRLFDREQRATHGLAWLATYVEAIRQSLAYAERLHAGGALGETEEILIRLGLGEYLAQIAGGIAMSPPILDWQQGRWRRWPVRWHD